MTVSEEVYMPDADHRSPYGSHLMNSCCHAWRCTPRACAEGRWEMHTHTVCHDTARPADCVVRWRRAKADAQHPLRPRWSIGWHRQLSPPGNARFDFRQALRVEYHGPHLPRMNTNDAYYVNFPVLAHPHYRGGMDDIRRLGLGLVRVMNDAIAGTNLVSVGNCFRIDGLSVTSGGRVEVTGDGRSGRHDTLFASRGAPREPLDPGCRVACLPKQRKLLAAPRQHDAGIVLSFTGRQVNQRQSHRRWVRRRLYRPTRGELLQCDGGD